MRSGSIAVGPFVDKRICIMIRDPDEALEEIQREMADVDAGIEASSTMVTIYIKRSDILEVSSSILYDMNTGGIVKRGKNTSQISNFPNIINTT